MSTRDDAWSEGVARELDTAERLRSPLAPLTERWPDLTVQEAYAVQTRWIGLKLERGAKIVGHKIGLTSLAMQKMLGVDQPDYGHLLDTMMIENAAELPAGELIQPRIEGEIAFRLGATLTGPGISEDDVLRATEEVLPALEIIDSRVRDWKIQLPDTIADNASSARVVLGPRGVPVEAVDLRLVGMLLKVNGDIVQSGAGGAVLGHPATAVAWLANQLATFGTALEAGSIIMSGSLTAAMAVGAGMAIEAEFDRLGTASVHFGA